MNLEGTPLGDKIKAEATITKTVSVACSMGIVYFLVIDAPTTAAQLALGWCAMIAIHAYTVRRRIRRAIADIENSLDTINNADLSDETIRRFFEQETTNKSPIFYRHHITKKKEKTDHVSIRDTLHWLHYHAPRWHPVVLYGNITAFLIWLTLWATGVPQQLRLIYQYAILLPFIAWGVIKHLRSHRIYHPKTDQERESAEQYYRDRLTDPRCRKPHH